MKKQWIAAFALAAALPVFAQQKLLPAQSEIAFTARQIGVPMDGKFKKFDAQVAFDPKNLPASKIAFTVDLGSVTMGSAESEAELPKAEWFNTKAFPQASFQSSKVTALGGGKFDVDGKLTIKGSSQDVKVPVTVTQSGPNTTAVGAFKIKRLAFKIGDGEWKDTSMVADDVDIKFKLALSGVPAL
jgi:polyisoprenoid-binding protein YceI